MKSGIKVSQINHDICVPSIHAEWALPVVIELGGDRNFVSIGNAFEAANCLLNHWPFDEGDAMENALEVCFAACKGRALPANARIAFLEAVGEARLYLRPHFGGH